MPRRDRAQVTLANMKLGRTQQAVVDMAIQFGAVSLKHASPAARFSATRLLDKGVLVRPKPLVYELSPAYKKAKGLDHG